jgi:hypothetical protein
MWCALLQVPLHRMRCRLVELLLGSEEAGAAGLEEDVCCVLSRLPFQEPEAATLLGTGGVSALTARLSAAPRPTTRHCALAALTNLSLFPATRSAILQVSSLSLSPSGATCS